MTLSEMDIPIKSQEEITLLKKEILDKTEKMSNYLKYILAVKDNPNFNKNPRTLAVIEEYSKWKEKVIQYNYQQYRIIKSKLMGTSLNQNDLTSEGLRSKVEQELFMKTETLDQRENNRSDRLKDIKRKLMESGFEMPNLEEILKKTNELESDDEIVENNGRTIR